MSVIAPGDISCCMLRSQPSTAISSPSAVANALWPNLLRFSCSDWSNPRVESMELLRWIHTNLNAELSLRVVEDVAARGDLEMVRFLQQHRSAVAISPEAFTLAWESNHFDVFVCLMEAQPLKAPREIAVRNAFSGNVEFFKLLDHYGYHTEDRCILEGAAESGCLETVRLTVEQMDMGCSREALNRAAKYGRLHIVQ